MHLHNYGIAEEESEIRVPRSSLQGQSTYIGDISERRNSMGNEEVAILKSFKYAVHDAGAKPTLLHINCEGCEWSLLPGAVRSGFVQDVPVIQVGFHNYGDAGLGQRAIEYCEIRKQLSRTHKLVDGAVPFAWERWVLRPNDDARVSSQLQSKEEMLPPATLVTAYFNIISKHPAIEYDKWAENILSMQDAMVIFTTPDLISRIKLRRAHAINRTRIVPTTLDDFKMAKMHPEEFWQHQLHIDPERGVHKNYQLYWIWNQKAEF
eukprot:CAMPEP_0185821162 /NCGR_PEP_ID=MMETSP1322-20130828/24781_1 /TAXON_ID=265543 /ORGANISM="Minutocellus polymorphus, Strain RCC2270" /LENGTH=263 /DNA_ID=CAMNT_0028518523 /DNA_START=51 /DNA_END=839 /DNA_ORIENTATION=-